MGEIDVFDAGTCHPAICQLKRKSVQLDKSSTESPDVNGLHKKSIEGERMQKKNNSQFLWFDLERLQQEEKQYIYMDNAATTFPKPECVCDAMDRVNRYLSVNAGRGSYQLAQIATEGMDILREELLHMVHAKEMGEVFFTSSATIACNQIIGGCQISKEDVVYVSPFLHNAMGRTLYLQEQACGCTVKELPINEKTLEIDLEKMEYVLRKNPPAYVFVSHVCNVTGYVLPVAPIYKIAKNVTDGRAKVIVDGAQSVGLIDIDYRQTPYDALIFAGHKTLYGPFGIAGFVKKKDFALQPYLAGGTGSESLTLSMPTESPNNLESGSPNLPAIAGLYAAVQFLKEQGIDTIREHEKAMTDLLVKGLSSIDGVTLYVPDNREQHIGIVSFSVKDWLGENYLAEDIGTLLDREFGIAVRTGYHCAPLIHKYLKDEEYNGTVRASVGWFTKKEQVEQLVQAVRKIVEGEL